MRHVNTIKRRDARIDDKSEHLYTQSREAVSNTKPQNEAEVVEDISKDDVPLLNESVQVAARVEPSHPVYTGRFFRLG